MGQDQPFEPVEPKAVESYEPGEAPRTWTPGDFLLTHGDAWSSKIIRFGQGLRIHGDDRVYTHWNHAALVVTARGDIVEALGNGVTRGNASRYKEKEYEVVRIDSPKNSKDRQQAVAFGKWAAEGKQRYGFVTIASIAFTLLTGAKFSFFVDGQQICSGLVARSMERTGAIFSRDPIHIMPADLAKYYGVRPPAPPAPLG